MLKNDKSLYDIIKEHTEIDSWEINFFCCENGVWDDDMGDIYHEGDYSFWDHADNLDDFIEQTFGYGGNMYDFDDYTFDDFTVKGDYARIDIIRDGISHRLATDDEIDRAIDYY